LDQQRAPSACPEQCPEPTARQATGVSR